MSDTPRTDWMDPDSRESAIAAKWAEVSDRITELERENAELRELCASRYDAWASMQSSFERERDENAELRQRLEAAEKDARRIDWMQQTQRTPWRVYHQEWQYKTDGSNSKERIDIFDGWSVDSNGDNPLSTIRAAIDAAMQEK